MHLVTLKDLVVPSIISKHKTTKISTTTRTIMNNVPPDHVNRIVAYLDQMSDEELQIVEQDEEWRPIAELILGSRYLVSDLEMLHPWFN